MQRCDVLKYAAVVFGAPLVSAACHYLNALVSGAHAPLTASGVGAGAIPAGIALLLALFTKRPGAPS